MDLGGKLTTDFFLTVLLNLIYGLPANFVLLCGKNAVMIEIKVVTLIIGLVQIR